MSDDSVIKAGRGNWLCGNNVSIILGFTTRTKDPEMAERVVEKGVGLCVYLCGRSL